MRDLKDVLLKDFDGVDLVLKFGELKDIAKYNLRTLLRFEHEEIDIIEDYNNHIDYIINEVNDMFKNTPYLFSKLMYGNYLGAGEEAIDNYSANINLFCYLIVVFNYRMTNSSIKFQEYYAKYGFIDLFNNLNKFLKSKYSVKISEVIENCMNKSDYYYSRAMEDDTWKEMLENDKYFLMFLNMKAEIRKDLLNDFISIFPKKEYVDYMKHLIPLSAAVAEILAANIIYTEYPKSNGTRLSDFYFKDITDEYVKTVLD